MFERQQKLEKESGPEKMAGFADKFAEKETNLNIHPGRAATFMLLTLLALSTAMGDKAEAQVRGIGPQSWGGQRITGQVLGRTTFEVGSAIDRKEAARRDQIERDYVKKLTELERQEMQYPEERNQIEAEKIRLRQEYEKSKRPSLKHEILNGAIQGVRGW